MNIQNYALTNKILPKFIYSENDIVKTLFDLAKDYSDDINFGDYLKEARPKFPEVSDLELIQFWVSENKGLKGSFKDVYSLSIQEEINNIFGEDVFNIDKIILRIDEFKNNLKEITTSYLTRAKQKKKLAQELEKVTPFPSSNIDIKRLDLEIVTDIKFISLYQIFDNISTSENVPFVLLSLKNSQDRYYKIFEGLKLPDDEDERLLFLNFDPEVSDKSEEIVNRIFLKVKIDDEYQECVMYYSDFNEKKIPPISGNKFIIRIKADTTSFGEGEEASRILTEKILSIFNGISVGVKDIKTYRINGLFFIASEKDEDTGFIKQVLSDMIMNNEIFSGFMSIDESLKPSKEKSETYVHFNNPNNNFGDLTATFITKRVGKEDLDIRNKSRNIFPYGSRMIRVNVKGPNLKSLHDFKKIITRLFKIYNQSQNEVITFYRKYLPKFGEQSEEKEISKTLDLKYLVPDLFVSDYSRKCPDKPTIIEEEEVEDYEKNGYQIMKFPKDKKEGNQNYYICDHEKMKYPGVSINNLENCEKYPFIPCCFKDDQNKKNSPYREYFYDEEIEEAEQQRIIQTAKVIPKNKFAILPENLNSLFKSLDGYNFNLRYLREGTNRTVNSFLECVLIGEEEKLPSKNIEKFFQKIRKDLTNDLNFLNICRQECYDQTVDEIKNDLLNENKYLDPSRYIRLLEEKYSINIFHFKREKDSDKTYLKLPRHLNGYFYHPKNHSKTIMIYEHYGSESQRCRAKFPQCELIVWEEKDKDYQIVFDTSSDFIKKIDRLYQLLASEYHILDKINKPIILPSNLKIESQFIDNYGKTRAIQTHGLYIITSPLPPLPIQSKSLEITKNDINKVDNFIKKFGLEKVRKLRDEGRIIGYLPPQDFSSGDFVKLEFLLKETEDSLLKIFEKDRKMSKILLENFIFNYSSYVHFNGFEIGNSSLSNFVKNEVEINKKYVYNFDSKSFQKNGKIIVKNEETLKRLIFLTRVNMVRNLKELKDYFKFDYLQNFYNNISDFKQSPLQIIIKGKKETEEFLSSYTLDNKVYNSVQINDTDFPYFLFLESKTFIAKPAKDRENAEKIGLTWLNYEYISSKESQENFEKIPSRLYLYNNINDFKIIGDDTGINVLVYKKEGELQWIALLQI
jgi:hypothetical protein